MKKAIETIVFSDDQNEKLLNAVDSINPDEWLFLSHLNDQYFQVMKKSGHHLENCQTLQQKLEEICDVYRDAKRTSATKVKKLWNEKLKD